jgi:alpha-tubulin suppressor-like RCC1 family protein
VTHVSTSVGLTVALTKEGDIYCFGLNRWGQCSVVDKTGKHIYKPTKIIPSYPCKFSQVDTGLQHCVALSDDGYVYAWGKGTRGQLGKKYNNLLHYIF